MGQLAWYVARGGGLTAWLLLSVTVVLGLLTASRILGRRVAARSSSTCTASSASSR